MESTASTRGSLASCTFTSSRRFSDCEGGELNSLWEYTERRENGRTRLVIVKFSGRKKSGLQSLPPESSLNQARQYQC
jgi:hypothetical protein